MLRPCASHTMVFNSEKGHRRSIRLKQYDYSRQGHYFVTICTHHRENLLGAVVEGQVRLSQVGLIAHECWRAITRHFPNTILDTYVVMPNHLHGIVIITRPAGRGAACCAPTTGQTGKMVPGSLPTIVRSFKSASAKRANELSGAPATPLWQRNYYEHVIRYEKALNKIREYICANPHMWPYDPENPARAEPADEDIEDILARVTGFPED